MTASIFVAPYEPEHEVAGKLLELAAEAGYPAAVITTSRDQGLVLGAPDDVAEKFIAVRADLWPAPDDGEELVDDDGDPATPPVRRRRAAAKPTEPAQE